MSLAQGPAFRLELKPAKGAPNGNAAAARGTATPKGDRFFVPNVFVLQPVVVTVFAKKPGDAIKVRLGKDRWDETLLEGITGADGKAILKFRTQGEVRITVSADAPAKPYSLLVWVGDEVKVEPESAIMPMSTYRKSNPEGFFAGLGGKLGWIVAGVLALALTGIGGFMLARRGSK